MNERLEQNEFRIALNVVEFIRINTYNKFVFNDNLAETIAIIIPK